MTVVFAAVSIFGTAVVGVVVMAARRGRFGPIRTVAIAVIEAMRNTPIMVQIFVLYFGVPSIGLTPSAFTCAVIARVLQNSAYTGEIYRAGVESVHRTQMEAALALGMRRLTALWSIVMPQAMRRVLPVLGSQAVVVLKDTSIASTISLAELTHTGKLLLDRSAAPYETFLAIGLLYLALSALVLGGMRIVAWCFRCAYDRRRSRLSAVRHRHHDRPCCRLHRAIRCARHHPRGRAAIMLGRRSEPLQAVMRSSCAACRC